MSTEKTEYGFCEPDNARILHEFCQQYKKRAEKSVRDKLEGAESTINDKCLNCDGLMPDRIKGGPKMKKEAKPEPVRPPAAPETAPGGPDRAAGAGTPGR